MLQKKDGKSAFKRAALEAWARIDKMKAHIRPRWSLALRKRRGAKRMPHLITRSYGFDHRIQQKSDPVYFADIRAIFAYKLDSPTNDLLCCDIITVTKGSAADRDGAVKLWTVHEDMGGFDAVMQHMENLKDFDESWLENIDWPAFADQRILIYRCDFEPYRRRVG